MDRRARGRRWLARLTPADLELLAGSQGGVATLAPEEVEDRLAAPEVFEAVLRPPTSDDALEVVGLSAASPLLVFGCIIHRARAELDGSSVVAEWTGRRERLPVFAGAELRAFLDDGDHRLFLAELLASYTRAGGGAVMTVERGTVRRHAFSDLDPAGMARLLDLVADEARPALYRRLGDSSLFLTGVFPDHTSRRHFAPIQVDRLARSLHGTTDELADALATHGAVGLLEHLGRQWYQRAIETSPVPAPRLADVASISDNFPVARRVLNHLADRWLFPFRSHWLPAAP